MLRDGLLSPHSKILPQNIRSDPPVVATDGNRHCKRCVSSVDVTVSYFTTAVTKSGVFKDERDTIRRRVRHRDGRLLRGGIGLTTGLGWSDRCAEPMQAMLIVNIF
jgi:large subunit ribosomal protein LP1